MGWPWVVDCEPGRGNLSKQGVCRFLCVFHNKERATAMGGGVAAGKERLMMFSMGGHQISMTNM